MQLPIWRLLPPDSNHALFPHACTHRLPDTELARLEAGPCAVIKDALEIRRELVNYKKVSGDRCQRCWCYGVVKVVAHEVIFC